MIARSRKEYAMKSFYAQSVAWALGLAWFASAAHAQQYQPSLLPIPAPAPAYQPQAYQPYPARPVAYRNDLWDDKAAQPEAGSPSDTPSILPAPPMAQPDQSVLSGGDFKKATSGNWAGDNVVQDDGAAYGIPGCTPCQNFWYGSVGAVMLTRSQQNHFLITSNTDDTRLLCSCQLDMGWSSGVDVTLGRTFNCGNNAIQFNYWGLNPSNCDTTAYRSTLGFGLNSGIDFTGATYNGAAANLITLDGSMQQGIVRQSYNNFEGNLLGQCWGNGFIGGNMASCSGGLPGGMGGCGSGYCGPRWGCGWMMGVRYFQFDNGFSFNADGVDEVWNDDVNELCFHVNLENKLWGFQVGGGWNWSVLNCLQIYGLGKAGLYNNSISQNMSLHGAGGQGQFGDGSDILINNSQNRLAMIGQLDLGARYSFGCHFSMTAGYRIMAASGVALYEHNIPTDFQDSYYATKIESDGMLLLHGAYVGGEFRF
jgi:hypothetical protein